MRVFGTPRHDASGNLKPRWQVRRELDAQAGAWRPEPRCDRCRQF
ncbi:hypothetical protein AMETH_6717 [Amycolatopsis methanolica 239]|uniref:Uncharacterized protein n=1 Tax=Amycolatopsis methanolica 239 TaxID=1068978 RepID=A0A076MZL9_AMYME|nr:hypothetical protein AMETH_6717 [Amycolatopsis methanolica 239]